MASSVQKLLKRSQVTRIVASLQNPQTPNLTAPRVFYQPHLIGAKPDTDSKNLLPSLLLEFPNSENLTALSPYLFYPSFPFGFCLNPNSSTGSIQLEAEDDDVSGDPGTMWADSVKKKRKKKMNKHKYRKLKKRLRRQS